MKKRVLVVDPEADVRQLVSRVLSDAGFSTSAAETAETAARHVQGGRTDLLLADLALTAERDWWLLSKLSEHSRRPAIVAMGSSDSVTALRHGVPEGLSGLVLRPFHMGELVETCRRAIEARERPVPATAAATDRRRGERRSLQVAVHLISSKGTPMALGELTDLSASGAQVILMAPFEVGSAVRVSLDPALTGRILDLPGIVRWQSPVATGFSHGLEFRDLSPEARDQLERLRVPGKAR